MIPALLQGRHVSRFIRLFLWWWPALPAGIRYALSGLVVVGAAIAWIITPEAWSVWILLGLIGLFMMLYGEESEARKKGYRF